MEKLKEYFLGVKKEFLRIKWPTKRDLIKYSLATIVFIIITSLFFLSVDAINAYLRETFTGAN